MLKIFEVTFIKSNCVNYNKDLQRGFQKAMPYYFITVFGMFWCVITD